MTAQAMEALAKGTKVRMFRAQVKRDIAAGLVTVPEVLHLPELARMTLGELLAAQYGWGPLRTARFLARNGWDVTKRIGSLTERQCGVIAVELAA